MILGTYCYSKILKTKEQLLIRNGIWNLRNFSVILSVCKNECTVDFLSFRYLHFFIIYVQHKESGYALQMAVRNGCQIFVSFPIFVLCLPYWTHSANLETFLPCFVFAFFIEVPVKASSLLSGACQEEVMSTVLVFLWCQNQSWTVVGVLWNNSSRTGYLEGEEFFCWECFVICTSESSTLVLKILAVENCYFWCVIHMTVLSRLFLLAQNSLLYLTVV